MATITQMPCPRCSVPLDERRFGRASVHGCRTCGGVWLDKEQARVVIARVQGALPLVIASEKIARAARSKTSRAKTPRCPLDAEPLNLVETDFVEVDVCPLHGTWFDAGEVGRIANAFTDYKAKASPPAPAEPSGSRDPIDLIGAFILAVFAIDDELD
jgi:Zn-finger nucleic acid-binding protein